MSEAKNSPDASTNHDSEDLWAEALEQQRKRNPPLPVHRRLQILMGKMHSISFLISILLWISPFASLSNWGAQK